MGRLRGAGRASLSTFDHCAAKRHAQQQRAPQVILNLPSKPTSTLRLCMFACSLHLLHVHLALHGPHSPATVQGMWMMLSLCCSPSQQGTSMMKQQQKITPDGVAASCAGCDRAAAIRTGCQLTCLPGTATVQ